MLYALQYALHFFHYKQETQLNLGSEQISINIANHSMLKKIPIKHPLYHLIKFRSM